MPPKQALPSLSKGIIAKSPFSALCCSGLAKYKRVVFVFFLINFEYAKNLSKRKVVMKNVTMGRLSGFTLIELLVVVLIIGILAAIAVPQYQIAVFKSRVAAGIPLAQALKTAQDAYFLANGSYAKDPSQLDISLPAKCSYKLFPGHSDNTIIFCPQATYRFRQDALDVAQVLFMPKNCPGGSQVRLVFPYNGTRAWSVYQAFTDPYCDTWLAQDDENSNRICKILSGDGESRSLNGFHAYKLKF